MSRNTTAKSFSNTAATGTATKPRCDSDSGILKIKMVTVQVNGNEMAWVCENFFDTPNQMPEYVGAGDDPHAHPLKNREDPRGSVPSRGCGSAVEVSVSAGQLRQPWGSRSSAF